MSSEPGGYSIAAFGADLKKTKRGTNKRTKHKIHLKSEAVISINSNNNNTVRPTGKKMVQGWFKDHTELTLVLKFLRS